MAPAAPSGSVRRTDQDGVNLQHNGIYRDDPDAFLELQKVRGAVFNISLIWDQRPEQQWPSDGSIRSRGGCFRLGLDRNRWAAGQIQRWPLLMGESVWIEIDGQAAG